MADQPDLAYYLAAWRLADPQPLAVTATSHIYTVTSGDERAVLKLLTPLGLKDERRGGLALRWFDGRGAVRLLRSGRQAQLLEYAGGEPLAAVVKRGDDERAAGIIGEVLNQLHRFSPIQPRGQVPLHRWFRSLFNRARADRAAGQESVYVRGAKVARALLAEPQQVCALHGDIHHENIRFKEGRGWLAFDPKGLIGERTYDAANTFCNPWDVPGVIRTEARVLAVSAILARALGVTQGRLLSFVFAYACLSASWWLDDDRPQEAAEALIIAGLAEPHIRR